MFTGPYSIPVLAVLSACPLARRDTCRERRSSNSGFTLIETLIALTLVLLALTMSLAFLAQQPRLVARLEAQALADQALEASLETLRAGGLVLETGPAQWLVPAPVQLDAGTLAVELEVLDGGIANLYEVTLWARYSLEGQPRSRHVTTKAWRP